MSAIVNGGGGGFTVGGVAGNTTGTTASISSGTMVLAGGNNITLSQNGNSITFSGANQGISVGGIAGNTTGTTASVTSGALTLAGGNNITLSQSGNAITISQRDAYNSFWYPSNGNDGVQIANSTISNGVVIVQPAFERGYATATRAHLLASVSISTHAASSFAHAFSGYLGVYTRSGSTLNLASSGSTVHQFSEQSGGSITNLSGHRYLTIPISINVTPGDYWVAYMQNTASTNANFATISIRFQQALETAVGGGPSPLGSATAMTYHTLPFAGQYTVSTASLPASIVGSDLIAFSNGASSVYAQFRPIAHFINFTEA